MKICYTQPALDDLKAIERLSGFCVTTGRSPCVPSASIAEIERRIGEYPEASPRVMGFPGVHVVALIRFPYRLFYRIEPDGIEIIHIRHAARRPWPPDAD